MNRLLQSAFVIGAFTCGLSSLPLHAQFIPANPRLEDDFDVKILKPGGIPHQPDRQKYEVLDNIEGDRVVIMNPPINPMVWDESTLRLWAIDNHNSEVHLFDNGTGAPSATWGVPAGPVSMALWNDPSVGGGERLVVVCRTSWVVCVLDSVTGEILGVLQMQDPATGESLGEPADILIDASVNRAFVSCSAADAVVEIDLLALAITDVYRIASKSPTFLSFAANGDVLVTPQFSGNNTVVHRGLGALNGMAKGLGIMNLDDPAIAVSGLRDHDVFRILRSGASAGTVEPAVTGAGTVLFGHTINTGTGDLWVLNTEANNKNPAQQDEPSLNGDFAFNRISISTLQPGQTVSPHKIIDLDVFGVDGMGDPIYEASRSMAQPYNLYSATNGFTFVVGMLSDNVTLYDANGDFVLEWDLPKGSIPRDVTFSPFLNSAFVYCWGNNEVLGYVIADPVAAPWITIDLGEDPLPSDLQAGRALMFSAEFSQDNRFSCLTCHVDGHADFVPWPLSGPNDDKGPMTTQSLTGLETVHPFHWRGERPGTGNQLMVDFNGAFTGLLGSSRQLNESPGDEWDKFEDFVLALQQPANPRQSRRRLLRRHHQPPLFAGSMAADSLTGVLDFEQSCVVCHAYPKGTTNDIIADGVVFGELNPHRIDFKVAPLQALWRRHQDSEPTVPGVQFETVDFVDSIPNLNDFDFYPTIGVGFSHAGLFVTLQHFVSLFLLPPAVTSNVTGFVDQWDSGLAPVTYRAWFVDENAPAEVFSDINGYLVPQCTTPKSTGSGQSILNGDFAVIGTFNWMSSEIPMRWFWDPKVQRLIPEDSTIPPQRVSTLLRQARNGESANTFIGLPVGTARRFAVDKDGDDLFNIDELNQPGIGTNIEVVDSDGDGFWDGHEVENGSDPTDILSVPNDTTPPTFVNDVTVLWRTAKTAVVHFETSEQTTATILYQSTDGHSGSATSPYFARRHRVVLANLAPSTSPSNPSIYTGSVILMDHAGLTTTSPEPLPPIQMTGFIGPVERVKAGDAAFSVLPTSPTSSMTVQVQAVMRHNSGAPIGMAGYQVIASVTLDEGTTPVALDTMGTPQAFTVLEAPYSALPGPFVLSDSLTDASGFANLTFSVPSALAGQKLTVHIQGIQRPGAAWTISAPDFDHMGDWSFTDTPAHLRTISTTL